MNECPMYIKEFRIRIFLIDRSIISGRISPILTDNLSISDEKKIGKQKIIFIQIKVKQKEREKKKMMIE